MVYRFSLSSSIGIFYIVHGSESVRQCMSKRYLNEVGIPKYRLGVAGGQVRVMDELWMSAMREAWTESIQWNSTSNVVILWSISAICHTHVICMSWRISSSLPLKTIRTWMMIRSERLEECVYPMSIVTVLMIFHCPPIYSPCHSCIYRHHLKKQASQPCISIHPSFSFFLLPISSHSST